MPVAIFRKQFTVVDYARMREIGILAEDDRVELIAGEVRQMSPLGSFHAAIVKRLNTMLSRLVDITLIVSVQDPTQLDDYSEPQPDLAILQYRDDFYATRIQSPMMYCLSLKWRIRPPTTIGKRKCHVMPLLILPRRG